MYTHKIKVIIPSNNKRKWENDAGSDKKKKNRSEKNDKKLPPPFQSTFGLTMLASGMNEQDFFFLRSSERDFKQEVKSRCTLPYLRTRVVKLSSLTDGEASRTKDQDLLWVEACGLGRSSLCHQG